MLKNLRQTKGKVNCRKKLLTSNFMKQNALGNFVAQERRKVFKMFFKC